MDVQVIAMDRMAALAAFRQYRIAVAQRRRDRRLAEDMAAMNAFRAAAKGQTLIDINSTTKPAGVFESGYPKLALTRADREWCWVEMRPDGSAAFQGVEYLPTRHDRTLVRRFVDGTYPSRPTYLKRRRAMVPTIPPHLMPKHDLSNYFILWEAVWEPAPPVDPMLLKHVGGSLYAVLAAWDLTPIEQAVLRDRLESSRG